MKVNIGEKSQEDMAASNIETAWDNYQPKRSGRSYGAYNSYNSFYNNKRRQDYRWIFQILISGAILLVIAGVYKLNIPFTGPLKNTVNYLMNTETNVQPVFAKIVQLASQQGNMEWPVIDDAPHSAVTASTPVSPDLTLSLPVSGKVSRLYGWTVHDRDKIQVFHQGIDIDVPEGTQVKAAGKGKVIKTGEDETLGKYVLIQHAGGDIVRYAGLSEILVENDQPVKAGEIIAKTGSCEGDGSHLHFEVIENGKPVDPLGKLGLDISSLKSTSETSVDDKNGQ